MAQIKSNEWVSRFLISAVRARSDGGAVGSDRGWHRLTLTAACHGRAWQFARVQVSRAMVVSFRSGLLLRDHSDQVNSIRLTLIGGGRQRSPAMVRQLGRCLVMVRAASGEASTPRMCAEASSSSLLASRPINCFERR
jgi:hypothetical protein